MGTPHVRIYFKCLTKYHLQFPRIGIKRLACLVRRDNNSVYSQGWEICDGMWINRGLDGSHSCGGGGRGLSEGANAEDKFRGSGTSDWMVGARSSSALESSSRLSVTCVEVVWGALIFLLVFGVGWVSGGLVSKWRNYWGQCFQNGRYRSWFLSTPSSNSAQSGAFILLLGPIETVHGLRMWTDWILVHIMLAKMNFICLWGGFWGPSPGTVCTQYCALFHCPVNMTCYKFWVKSGIGTG